MPRALKLLVIIAGPLLVGLLGVLVALFWERAPFAVHMSVVLFTFLVIVVLVLGPRASLANRFSEEVSALEIAKLEEECRKTLGQVLAGMAVVAGLYVWAAADSTTREDRINHRIAQAVDQLGRVDGRGVKVVDARLAAIASLESIGERSSADSPSIIRMLLAYLRKHAEKWSERQCDDRDPPVNADDHDDIRHALLALARLYGAARRTDLDLTGIVVRATKLPEVDLRRSLLTKADFNGAILVRANFEEADLNQTDLRRANLDGASLKGTSLWRACVRKANLRGADLRNAQLWKADLEKSLFTDALLAGADFEDANVAGADFRGVDLSEAHNLSADQIRSALTDERTRLRR